MPSVVGLLEQRELGARRRVDELREEADRIHAELAVARSWLPVSRRLCTLALNRQVAPATGDLKLATLAAHYGVRQHRAHDALDDARVLAGVLRGSLTAVAFTVDEDEQVSCDEGFVFYGASESCDGTVRLATDGPTEQTVTVDLAALPTAARKVVIAAAIDGTSAFGTVGAIEITIAPGTSDTPLVQATLDAATTERTLLLAELYRRGPLWRVRAVGQGYDHGLATLARGFGVEVIG
jgi:stress response protein SCP2